MDIKKIPSHFYKLFIHQNVTTTYAKASNKRLFRSLIMVILFMGLVIIHTATHDIENKFAHYAATGCIGVMWLTILGYTVFNSIEMEGLKKLTPTNKNK